MSAGRSPGASRKPQRRTQAERSGSMRERLVEATVACLADLGYAGTTISAIVARARVSHGASGHHFSSKNDLIVAAADTLMRRTYRVLGELLLGIAEEDDRLEALVHGAWDGWYSKPLMRAYLELALASQRDPPLALSLSAMTRRIEDMFEKAVDHYFERRNGSSEDPVSLFMLLQDLLLGMAAQSHLLKERGAVKQQLAAWTRIAGQHLRARRGVRTPPPRPSGWDQQTGWGIKLPSRPTAGSG